MTKPVKAAVAEYELISHIKKSNVSGETGEIQWR